jgi:hypothetical protein
MAIYTANDGQLLPCSSYKAVAAAQTTAQLSAPGNAAERGDFLAGVQVTWSSSATGTVIVHDGATALTTIPSPVTGAVDLTPRYVEFGITAQTTKGFNITRLFSLLPSSRQVWLEAARAEFGNLAPLTERQSIRHQASEAEAEL